MFGDLDPAKGRVLCSGSYSRRKPHLAMLRHTFPKKQLIVDVGSLDAKDALGFAGGTGHYVWTFEPSPTKADTIRSRIKGTNVTFYPMALSDFDGTAQFEMRRPIGKKARELVANQFGSDGDMLVARAGSSLAAGNATTNAASANRVWVDVPVRTLASLLPADARILLMKIDAQGTDFRVLRGAGAVLTERRVRHLKFEFAVEAIPGGFVEAVDGLKFLDRVGYSCIPCFAASATVSEREAAARSHLSFPMSATAFVSYYFAAARNGTMGSYDDIVCEPRRQPTEMART